MSQPTILEIDDMIDVLKKTREKLGEIKDGDAAANATGSNSTSASGRK